MGKGLALGAGITIHFDTGPAAGKEGTDAVPIVRLDYVLLAGKGIAG